MENNSLTMLDKAGIAAMAALNASYRPREGREGKAMDAAIQTDKIRTLAEYRRMNTEKFSTWNPEREDSNKLMRTYVIPITLASGEEIDLIVNSKGQDMACIYHDEDGNDISFHLTSRMQKEILKDALGEEMSREKFTDIQRILLPKTLEEFTEKVEKDKLVPEGKKDIEKRLQEDGKNLDEEEEEGLTVEEAAAATGIEEDVLSQFEDENGKIYGIRKTNDIENLSKQLDYELGLASSEVILLRVNDGATKDKGYVLNTDGTILYSSMDGRGNTELVTDIVNTGSVGDDIENVDKAVRDKEADSKKIVYEMSDGGKTIEYAEKGNEKEVEGYEMDAEVVLQEVETSMQNIGSQDCPYSEKCQQNGDVLFFASQKLKNLQTAYGVYEPNKVSELEERAKANWRQQVVEKEKEDAVGFVQDLAGAINPFKRPEGTDPREQNHDRDYSNGRMPRI